MKVNEFRPVTERIVSELRTICGDGHVLYGDEKRMRKYSHDQVAETKYARMPEVVVFPDSAQQVSEILLLANREMVPVTPRGAGSGLSGGAVPWRGGILLSLERMNRILEIDLANLVAVLEPGVVTNVFDTALAEHGLFFAGYPMSEEFCFVGGNVAENAGGGRAIKYGVTGRYVTGLEVVLPTGGIITIGGKRFKDVTGYDLLHLLVGSEGTLGIFTKIFIRLMPRPEHRATAVALFADVDAAIAVIPEILTRGRIVPTSIELLDRFCLHETCRLMKEESLPWREAGAMLLFETDGNDRAMVDAEADRITRIATEAGATGVRRARDEAEATRFWKIRKQVPWTLRQLGTHQSIEDIVVPIGHIPEMIGRIRDIAERYGVAIPVFGHAGDGNLHAHPVKPNDQPVEQWEELIPRILTDLYRAAAELGGTISGEHGIGHKRTAYLPLVMEETQIDLMRRIKGVFDPNGILNPGKVFDS